MTHKSESAQHIKDYITQSENQLELKVKTFRCDNGGEFISKDLKHWCSQKGIVLDYKIPYCPQQNGKAERINRTLMERARAMLNDSELPLYMW